MKNMKNWLIAVAGVFGIGAMVWAGVYSYTGTAIPVMALVNPPQVYTNAVVYFLVDQANVAASLTANNIVSSGTLTAVGATVYSPVSQVTVATNVPVGITATNMVIESTGGVVTFAQIGRIAADGPAIATATAVSGQYLILQSTTSVSTVVITTGTATAVLGDAATYTISSAKNPVALIYNATLAAWMVISQQ